jgi:hypothetical protein
MSLESSPILFHCFSNSGATVYQYMAEAMINDQQYEGMADRVLGKQERTEWADLGRVPTSTIKVGPVFILLF